jgi:hypothetical protein
MKSGSFVVAALLFGGASLPGAAQAGTREDVLAGAIRCGAIAQDREWLDCYYGAAQPMRASLRLVPVPKSQLDLLRNAHQGGTIGGARQDVLSLAIRCSDIAGDRQWLDCYYGAAQPMRARLGLVPVPPAQQTLQQRQAPRRMAVLAPAREPSSIPSSQPARMPPSPGLLEGLFGGAAPLVEKNRIASYSIGPDGLFSATLANGEVWRQTSGAGQARWTRNPSLREVEITRGVLRSFNFRVSGDPALYKVRRVR